MIRRRRSSTVNRTNSDLRILRGIKSRGRRVATQARSIGKLIRLRPHIRPAARRASSVYILAITILAVIGSILVLRLRKRAAPPSEARLAAVAVGRRRAHATRQHTTFGVRARRDAHQRNRGTTSARCRRRPRHCSGGAPRICREWPDRRDYSPRGGSAREGALSRDRADHASRARVKNAALERNARRVGALELERARAGLAAGGHARRGFEDSDAVARPAGDPLARGALARSRGPRVARARRKCRARADARRVGALELDPHGARGCASSSAGARPSWR